MTVPLTATLIRAYHATAYEGEPLERFVETAIADLAERRILVEEGVEVGHA